MTTRGIALQLWPTALGLSIGMRLALHATARAVSGAPCRSVAEPVCETRQGRLTVKSARDWEVFTE